MATMVQGQPRVGYDERETTSAKTSEGFVTATTVALGAAGTVALAIIGLVGGVPVAMMSVATIVFGGALFFQAARVIVRYDRLVRDAWGGESVRPKVGGGMSSEAFAGIAGIALGILAVLGLYPTILCAAAIIAFGAALMLGSRATTRFQSVRQGHYGLAPTTRQAVEQTTNLSGGGEMIAGIGAIALGILALIGIYPVTLLLVGLLAVGAALLAASASISGRISRLKRFAPQAS